MWKKSRNLEPFFKSVKANLNLHGVRFFIVIVSLSTENCFYTTTDSHHMNVLIFDKKGGSRRQGSIELFEPHGATEYAYDTTELQNTIKRFAGENSEFHEYEFISPLEISPSSISFQRLQSEEEMQRIASDPGGWCMAWSFYYAEQRVKYPTIAPRNLVKYLIAKLERRKNKDGGSLTEYIREYANYAITHYKSKHQHISS